LSNPQSWNRYSYGLNSTLIYADPSGHDPILFLVLVAIAVLTTACSSNSPQATSEPEPTLPNTLPVSGFEKPYDTNSWSGDINLSTNCYAYALDLKQDPRTGKNFINPPQPGEFSGYAIQHYANWDWKKVIELTKSDLKNLGGNLKNGSRDEPCKEASYKIALAIDPKIPDFHFYRQNPNGTFSHKEGQTPISSLDYGMKLIFDPQAADRRNSFVDANYTEFDGYYCITPPKRK
jgi:hypothetical protein